MRIIIETDDNRPAQVVNATTGQTISGGASAATSANSGSTATTMGYSTSPTSGTPTGEPINAGGCPEDLLRSLGGASEKQGSGPMLVRPEQQMSSDLRYHATSEGANAGSAPDWLLKAVSTSTPRGIGNA